MDISSGDAYKAGSTLMSWNGIWFMLGRSIAVATPMINAGQFDLDQNIEAR